MQRVLATIAHREADRVPFFLLLTMHGAKELGISIREYFSRAENVVEAQLRLREKYRHDCLYTFNYAAIEVEAWGGEVIFSDDGPPNAGRPLFQDFHDIPRLKPPPIHDNPCLERVLSIQKMLKADVGDEVPILGVVMSPFSLPVLQLGFARYIELIYEQPELFQQLMAANASFCVEWANAQLQAGATAIGYFNPLASPTIIPRDLYLRVAHQLDCRTIAQIKGPVALHLASGRCLPVLTDLIQTGAAIIGVSAQEELAGIKALCAGRMTVMGSLNGVEMRRWTPEMAVDVVRKSIAQAAPSGGYILSDNHGEIPWQVPEEVLHAISRAVHRWGRYPLQIDQP